MEQCGEEFQRLTKYSRELLGWPPAADAESPGQRRPVVRRVPLPPPQDAPPCHLWEAIARRRSVRRYAPRPLSLEQVSRLLWATQGITGRAGGHAFRAAPSAGALYPLDTYLVANRIDGLPAGLYYYRVGEHELGLLLEGDLSEAIAAAAAGQQMAAEAAAVFVWAAVLERSTPKYGQRAYRYIYLDAGHLGGQLHLACEALGLGCCAIGAFLDDEMDRLTGLDGTRETVIYLSTVGSRP